MVKSLDTIRQPINEELKIFEKMFQEAMQSPVPLLEKINNYIFERKGKQMRPMFILLCAQLCGKISDGTFHAATFVELLHTATLIHDDVVDDANERRGSASVNALWKNKVAVTVGDYWFTQALIISLKHRQYQLLEIVSVAVKALIEGELLQSEKARKLDIEEDIYFEIIRQKTASLIAAGCAAGAASTTEDVEVVEKMRLFGEKIGIAFQIKDDLFDYGTDDVGKPLGIDIKEKKMTLPLIYALNNASRSDKKRIIKIVKKHNENPEKVNEVIEFVRGSGGLEYAEKVMLQYRADAFEILHTFSPVPARESLEALVNYSTDRKK